MAGEAPAPPAAAEEPSADGRSAAAAAAPASAAGKAASAGDADLLRQFEELLGSCGCGGGTLSFEAWMRWPWLEERVGPPGSKALLTETAARALWARAVGEEGAEPAGAVDGDGFLRLARLVESECSRATAIQAVLRARAGRRAAGLARAKADKESSEARVDQDAANLAPFNPTPACAIAQALDALDVGPGDVVYDLGCGDGRLLVAAAQRGARGLGVEYDERIARRAREAVAEAGMAGAVEVVHGDACTVDLGPATKVFLYLVPSGIALLLAGLEAALERGALVASYTFSLPGREPLRVLTAESRAPECKVWLYGSDRAAAATAGGREPRETCGDGAG